MSLRKRSVWVGHNIIPFQRFPFITYKQKIRATAGERVIPTYIMIGDIRGQTGKPEKLLVRLGHTEVARVYTPVRDHSGHGDTRLVLFGDSIDRSSNNLWVIEIVRRIMIEVVCICGDGQPRVQRPLLSHRPSRYRFAVARPLLIESDTTCKLPGRIPFGYKNAGFLRLSHVTALVSQAGDPTDVPNRTDSQQHCDCLRVVQACWDKQDIGYFSGRVHEPTVIDLCFLLEAVYEGTHAFSAIEPLLKGTEIPLPAGSSFFDKDGFAHTLIRYNLWATSQTYQKVALVAREQLATIPDLPVVAPPYKFLNLTEAPPIFFRHYWLNGKPQLKNRNADCIDYSAGKDGALVYRVAPMACSRVPLFEILSLRGWQRRVHWCASITAKIVACCASRLLIASFVAPTIHHDAFQSI